MTDTDTDTDIVEELRDWAAITDGVQGSSARLVMLSGDVFTSAADEITRLRADLAHVQKSNKFMVEIMRRLDNFELTPNPIMYAWAWLSHRLKARRG